MGFPYLDHMICDSASHKFITVILDVFLELGSPTTPKVKGIDVFRGGDIIIRRYGLMKFSQLRPKREYHWSKEKAGKCQACFTFENIPPGQITKCIRAQCNIEGVYNIIGSKGGQITYCER